MAITIVHRGVVPTIKYVGTCGNCSTKVECEKQDRLYNDDGPCGRFGYYYVRCPVCQSGNIVVKGVRGA